MNMLLKAGFTSVMDVLVPHMPGNLADRKTYLAVAGEPVLIQTSSQPRGQQLHTFKRARTAHRRLRSIENPRSIRPRNVYCRRA